MPEGEARKVFSQMAEIRANQTLRDSGYTNIPVQGEGSSFDYFYNRETDEFEIIRRGSGRPDVLFPIDDDDVIVYRAGDVYAPQPDTEIDAMIEDGEIEKKALEQSPIVIVDMTYNVNSGMQLYERLEEWAVEWPGPNFNKIEEVIIMENGQIVAHWINPKN